MKNVFLDNKKTIENELLSDSRIAILDGLPFNTKKSGYVIIDLRVTCDHIDGETTIAERHLQRLAYRLPGDSSHLRFLVGSCNNLAAKQIESGVLSALAR